MWRLSYKQSRVSTLSRSGLLQGGRRRRWGSSIPSRHQRSVVSSDPPSSSSTADPVVPNQNSCREQQTRHMTSYPVMIRESATTEAPASPTSMSRSRGLLASEDERVAIKTLLTTMQAAVSKPGLTMTMNADSTVKVSPDWRDASGTLDGQASELKHGLHSSRESQIEPSGRSPSSQDSDHQAPLSDLLGDDDSAVTSGERSDLGPSVNEMPPSSTRGASSGPASTADVPLEDALPTDRHQVSTQTMNQAGQELHDRHVRIMENLKSAVCHQNLRLAVHLWAQACATQVPLRMFQPDLLYDLFLTLTNHSRSGHRNAGVPYHFSTIHEKHPEVAYRVLAQYRRLPDASPDVVVAMYSRLCRTLSKVTSGALHSEETLFKWARFCKRVGNDLQYTLNRQEQAILYPRFLDALIEQPNPMLGGRAKFVWDYMVQNNLSGHIDGRIVLNMVHFCRLTRFHYAPFPKFLKQAVDEGFNILPEVALHVLSCQFPFTDYDDVQTTLEVLLRLHRQHQSPNPETTGERQEEEQADDSIASTDTTTATTNMTKNHQQRNMSYIPDMGTLEHIAMAASQNGRSDICAMVWDMVEENQSVLGPPTESLYESVAMAFVMSIRQDHAVLSVLGEMEQSGKGFVPSRALARNLSRSLKYSIKRVDHFYHNLMEENAEGSMVTTASLNVIMAACAELGEVPRTLSVLDDMDRLGLVPNQDSYAYAMEAVARGIENFRNINNNRVESLLREAEFLLDTMEETGMPIGRQVFHCYMNALCRGNKIDVANQACWDALNAGMEVEDKTLFSVLSFNAEQGNLEEAEKLAKAMREHWNHLDIKFEKWRRRAQRDYGRAKNSQSIEHEDEPQKFRNRDMNDLEELSLRELLMQDLKLDEDGDADGPSSGLNERSREVTTATHIEEVPENGTETTPSPSAYTVKLEDDGIPDVDDVPPLVVPLEEDNNEDP